MNHKISIIVPVYNVEKYLSQCIDSVLKQSYKNFEVILIDDGSSDCSPKICDEYAKMDNRVIVYHIKNGGVSKARNYGIEKSNGGWITMIDSDDIVDKDYCKFLIEAALSQDDIDYVIGRTISFINDDINNLIDDGYNGNHLDIIYDKNEKEELYKSIFIDNKKIINYPHVSTCSAKLVRKKILENRKIKYNEKMFLYEDALFNAEIISSKKIAMIDKKIYFYRTNLLSSSRSFDDKVISQYDYVYECFEKFCIKNNINYNKYVSYFKIKNLNSIFTNYYCNNNYDKIFSKKMYNIYKDDLKNINFNILPKKRKMLKLLLGLHLYYCAYLMYKI